MKSKWLMPPTLLCASIAAMVALHFLMPLTRLIASPWIYLGIPLIFFGVVWNLWADQLFKRHGTTVKPHLEPISLVSSGPFRLSRNPMYVGMIAITLGLAIVLGTLTPMIVTIAFAAALALKFVRMEEEFMEQAFGEAWREYRNRVRRWL